jgi:alpha-aminoadipate/glutamate carrier protein LysW
LISAEYRYNRSGSRFEQEESTTINCMECDAPVAIPTDAIQGEIVSCKECGTSFELVREQSGSLFTLRQAELEEEDWGE